MTSTQQKGFNHTTLLEILNAREANIKFRKLNGDLRTMRCTLKADLLPSTIAEALDKTNRPSDLITVYDLDMNGWRSFHIDSIIEVL
jgi:hypothetical protein